MSLTPPPETSWLPERPDGLPTPATGEPEGERAWPPWIAPIGLVAGIAAAFVGGIVILAVHLATGGDSGGDQPPAVLLTGTALQGVAFVTAAILFARLSGPVAARHFGLRPTSWGAAIVWAIVAYVIFVVFSFGWDQIVDLEDSDDLLKELGVDESTVALVASAFLVCVVAPLVEEFFFRGFFYAALRNWRGPLLAAVLTGVLFGAIHLGSSPAEALLPLALLGGLLCLVYEKTGSLYPCVAMHAINNCLAFGISEEWDWQILVLLASSLAICTAVLLVVARRWRGPAAAPAPA